MTVSRKLCFVIMPYGEKKIDDGRVIDFDRVFTEIIEPAASRLKNPQVSCKRSKDDPSTGIITENFIKDIFINLRSFI